MDLFSGTGSISYEFASRGAAEVIAVELNYRHFAFVRRMARELGFRQMKVYKNDAFAACRRLRGQQFDLIFADPPYQLQRIPELPEAVFAHGLLAEGGIAVIEHPAAVDFSAHPRFREHRRYGSVNFSIFR